MAGADALDEFALIAEFLRPLAQTPAALGLMDDAACLNLRPGHDLVLTTDALIAGIHFFPDDPPQRIAQKLLRVNLSDLAAKGAEPAGYLLTLALPAARRDWIAAFASGLRADQDAFACPLLGGDTTMNSGPAALSVTALGWVPAGAMIRRAGAQAGEDVHVTGTLGDAALGLRLRLGEMALKDQAAADHLRARYLLPEPRLGFGRVLPGLASAAADVSDGLLADLGHVCAASGVGAEIAADALPLSAAAAACLAARPDLRAVIATGGDDYEIVFTAPPEARGRLAALARDHGLRLTRIGRITAGEGVSLRDGHGRPIPLEGRGFRHFDPSASRS